MLEKILSVILNEQLVEQTFIVLAFACPVVGLLLGLGIGNIRKRTMMYALKGLFFGLLGTLNYGMYRIYSYLVRYNPETGYVGLHHVSVLVMNVLLFAGLGIVLGILYRIIFKRYER